MKSRIVGLDVLRGLAAVAVMLDHHTYYYNILFNGPPPLTVVFEPGHFGVELFFVISGFVILMTAKRGGTLGAFVVSRFTRLMPAFLAALVLTTVALALRPFPPPLGTPTVTQFLANLTMAPTLFNQPTIDLPYWTLTYELVFYIYVAGVLLFRALDSIDWLGLLLVLVGAVCILTLDVKLHHRVAILLMLHYSNFFVIGICLWLIRSGLSRPITFFTLGCAVAATALGGGEQAFYARGQTYLVLAIACASLVWFATSSYQKWLAWSPLVYLGRISYPLYLVHAVLGFEIMRYGSRRDWSMLDGVIAACVASLVVAAAVHHLAEEPGTRWLRARFGRERQRRIPKQFRPTIARQVNPPVT